MAIDFSGFEQFSNTHQRLESRITITKTFSFGFPTKFFQDQQITTFQYAILYYNPTIKAVAIHFTNDEQKQHKLKIIKTSKGMGAGINATAFFKTYDIDPIKYHGKYDWEKEEMPGVGSVYVIFLKENGKQEVMQQTQNLQQDLQEQAQAPITDAPPTVEVVTHEQPIENNGGGA